MTEVFVRLDGETEPRRLYDCAWETVAPCGCTSGVMNAESADRDAAFLEMAGNRERVRRYEEDGFKFDLAPRDAVIDRMTINCRCTPQWGVDRPPIPAGHRWAHASGGKRAHLVPIPEADVRAFLRHRLHAEPICGAKPDLFERNWEWPTCRKCEAKARELAATPGSQT